MMARTRNRVIAGDYKKKKVALKFTPKGKRAVIDLGGWPIRKKLPIDKTTVESYEVKDESSALTAKAWGRHIISIQFKDGRKSLIEVTDKVYRSIMTNTF